MRPSKLITIVVLGMLACFALVWLIPSLFALLVTFTSANTDSGSSIGGQFSLHNFLTALQTPGLGQSFVNSIIITFSTILLVCICASTAAYAISRLSFFGRGIIYASLLLTLMIPSTALAIPFFIINKTFHLFNNYLGLILPYSALGIPFALVILKNFFDTFPRELEEAAIMDGASVFRIFLSIVLPNSISSMTVVVIWTFLAAWNEFLLALLFMTNDNMKPISLAPWSIRASTNHRPAP